VSSFLIGTTFSLYIKTTIMSQQENRPQSNETTENNTSEKEQIIAQNPNPRANGNIKSAPFEKTTENDGKTDDVGTEITDGEGG
jgi:hypothetical protein